MFELRTFEERLKNWAGFSRLKVPTILKRSKLLQSALVSINVDPWDKDIWSNAWEL